MKRHPALQDLSRDHFTALLRATHVRRALKDDPNVPSREQAKSAFLDLWHTELDLHFQEEEVDLLPHLEAAGDPDADALRARLETDHEGLREGFQALEAGADDARWDAVAEHLARHARWEEEELFEWFQVTLEEEALQRLWDASRRFRTRTRGEAAVGPQ